MTHQKDSFVAQKDKDFKCKNTQIHDFLIFIWHLTRDKWTHENTLKTEKMYFSLHEDFRATQIIFETSKLQSNVVFSTMNLTKWS